jgi:hypothetical protein
MSTSVIAPLIFWIVFQTRFLLTSSATRINQRKKGVIWRKSLGSKRNPRGMQRSFNVLHDRLPLRGVDIDIAASVGDLRGTV